MMSKKTKNHLLLVAIATLPLLFAANSEGMYTKRPKNKHSSKTQSLNGSFSQPRHKKKSFSKNQDETKSLSKTPDVNQTKQHSGSLGESEDNSDWNQLSQDKPADIDSPDQTQDHESDDSDESNNDHEFNSHTLDESADDSDESNNNHEYNSCTLDKSADGSDENQLDPDQILYMQKLEKQYGCDTLRPQFQRFLKISQNLKLFEELVQKSLSSEYRSVGITLDQIIDLLEALGEIYIDDYAISMVDLAYTLAEGRSKRDFDNVKFKLTSPSRVTDIKETLEAFYFCVTLHQSLGLDWSLLVDDFFSIKSSYPSADLTLFKNLVQLGEQSNYLNCPSHISLFTYLLDDDQALTADFLLDVFQRLNNMKLDPYYESCNRVYLFYKIYGALKHNSLHATVKDTCESALAAMLDLCTWERKKHIGEITLRDIIKATEYYYNGSLQKVISILESNAPKKEEAKELPQFSEDESEKNLNGNQLTPNQIRDYLHRLNKKYRCGPIRPQFDEFLAISSNLELFEEFVRRSVSSEYEEADITLADLIRLLGALDESEINNYLFKLIDIAYSVATETGKSTNTFSSVSSVLLGCSVRPPLSKQVLDAFRLCVTLSKELNCDWYSLASEFCDLASLCPSANLALFETLVRLHVDENYPHCPYVNLFIYLLDKDPAIPTDFVIDIFKKLNNMNIDYCNKSELVFLFEDVYEALEIKLSNANGQHICEVALKVMPELCAMAHNTITWKARLCRLMHASKYHYTGILAKVVLILDGKTQEEEEKEQLQLSEGVMTLIRQNPSIKRNLLNDAFSLQKNLPYTNALDILSFLQELVTVDPSVNALDYVRLRQTGADREKALRVLKFLLDRSYDLPNYLRIFYALGGIHHSEAGTTMNRLHRQAQDNKTTLTDEVDKFVIDKKNKQPDYSSDAEA